MRNLEKFKAPLIIFQFMLDTIINPDFCSQCGQCIEVCPTGLFYKDIMTKNVKYKLENSHFCIKCGHCMAICPNEAISINSIHYGKDIKKIEDHFQKVFFQLIKTRRSIRNFKNKLIPKEILEQIVKSISYAPFGYKQKLELLIINDPKIMQNTLPELINLYDSLVKAFKNPIARKIIKIQVGQNTFKALKNHVVPIMKSRLPDLKSGEKDTILRNAPAMILFHVDTTSKYIIGDIYIAETYCFLAAHNLGLGATVIDLIAPAIEKNPKLKQKFGIPLNNKILGAVILGYPKYQYKKYIKRNLLNVNWL